MTDPLIILAAALVAILGVGRLSRVLTYDDFPPAAWARAQWERITNDGPWAKLATCQWCATPWIMAFCLAWLAIVAAWLPVLLWTWWIFWAWLGLSYVASIVIARDEPE